MLEQEKTIKNAYATNQWKSVRAAIQAAVEEPEHSDIYEEPEKVLYRRLRKWIKASQLAAIRETFWLEIVPGKSGHEAKQKLFLDNFGKESMVHLHDEMQAYVATQIHHHEPLEDSRGVKHSKITRSYRDIHDTFNFRRDEAIEALKHQLRKSWNTDAQRIAAVRGMWRENDWQPIRNWLYDYIVDPLKSDDKMPTSIRRLRLRLKKWMDLYDATEQWTERLEIKRQVTLLDEIDDPEHRFQEVYRKEIWFRNDILEFLKSRKSNNEQEREMWT